MSSINRVKPKPPFTKMSVPYPDAYDPDRDMVMQAEETFSETVAEIESLIRVPKKLIFFQAEKDLCIPKDLRSCNVKDTTLYMVAFVHVHDLSLELQVGLIKKHVQDKLAGGISGLY